MHCTASPCTRVVSQQASIAMLISSDTTRAPITANASENRPAPAPPSKISLPAIQSRSHPVSVSSRSVVRVVPFRRSIWVRRQRCH